MNTRAQRGVSLIELVVVITVVALLSALSANLVASVVGSQQSTRARLTLAATADTASARLADELHNALPNSLRMLSNSEGVWIEWVPVVDGGRFRQAPDTTGGAAGDPLDPTDAADSAFDVLSTALGTLPASAWLVIHNLGTTGADAYAGGNRRAGLVLGNAGKRLNFTPQGNFDAAGNTERFFITTAPMSVACRDIGSGRFELWRYSGYGWQASQLSNHAAFASGKRTLLLTGLSGCSASYSTALANIGLLNMRFKLTDTTGDAQMEYLQQMAMDNTP